MKTNPKKLFVFTIALLTALCTLLTPTHSAHAQTFGYVDAQEVLNKMPTYTQAQKQLDALAETWKKELDQQRKEIDEGYKKFRAEQVLLTDNEQKQREDQIIEKERLMREQQKQRFGTNGDLFKKRQELVKPIQDEVYAAIEALASKKKIDFILDKSSTNMLFANPKFDYTNDLMKDLNIK